MRVATAKLYFSSISDQIAGPDSRKPAVEIEMPYALF